MLVVQVKSAMDLRRERKRSLKVREQQEAELGEVQVIVDQLATIKVVY